MIKLVRFFTRGPGAILVIIGIGLSIAWIIKDGQDKAKTESDKKQVTRALGQVNPSASVDQSQASKDTEIAKGKLNPLPRTTEDQVVQVSNTKIREAKAVPGLVSFYTAVATVPTAPPKTHPEPTQIWLPPSIFIPCVLVNTVESSHIDTPVVGEVLRDIYQNGNLIISAGTIVSSFAQRAVRDRIAVAGEWLLVFHDGKQLKVSGIACVRQADPSNQQFGPEDGSAGLQGTLEESDHWANAKAFLALLMTSTTQAGTAAVNSAVSTSRFGGGGVALPDTSSIQAKYLEQLLNGETGDGRFVRVQAGTEFYIFPTETTLPLDRSIKNAATTKDKEENATSIDPREMERRFIQQQMQPKQDEDTPHFKY